jgi:hypothetical protein
VRREEASLVKVKTKGRTRGDELTIRLVCRKLPGTRFDESSRPVRVREPVYLGIQKGKQVVGAVPADRHQVTYDVAVHVVKGKNGFPDFLGAYVHGKPNDRFLYLSRGEVKHGAAFEMFRRAKIRLTHLTWSALRKSIGGGGPLVAEISLTDKRGGPLCATIMDEYIKWRL